MKTANRGSGPLVSSVSRAGEYPAGTPTTLRQATQEFESLFIAQMMQSMRSTVPASDLMGSGHEEGIFREMLDQELSRRIAFAGGFGIGDLLYQQLAATPAGDEPQGPSPGRPGGLPLHPIRPSDHPSLSLPERSQDHESR